MGISQNSLSRNANRYHAGTPRWGCCGNSWRRHQGSGQSGSCGLMLTPSSRQVAADTSNQIWANVVPDVFPVFAASAAVSSFRKPSSVRRLCCSQQELAFRMPFHLYNEESLIVWGNKDYLDAGDQRHGDRNGNRRLETAAQFEVVPLVNVVFTQCSWSQASTQASYCSATMRTSVPSSGKTSLSSAASTRMSSATVLHRRARSRFGSSQHVKPQLQSNDLSVLLGTYTSTLDSSGLTKPLQ